MADYKFGDYEYPQSTVTLVPTDLSSKLRLADSVAFEGGFSQGGKRGVRSVSVSGTLTETDGGTALADLWDDFLAAHAPGAPQPLYLGRTDRYLMAEVASLRDPDTLIGSIDWEVGFTCADPYYYADEESTAMLTGSSDTFATTGEEGTITGGSDTLTVGGNAHTWPTITIVLSSAGTGGTLMLDTGGKSITLACSSSHLTMVVDMRRGQVTNGSGTDLTHLVTSGKFWSLQPGANTVTRTLGGATAPTVGSMTAAWRDRWH